jgi:hypothetical protein
MRYFRQVVCWIFVVTCVFTLHYFTLFFSATDKKLSLTVSGEFSLLLTGLLVYLFLTLYVPDCFHFISRVNNLIIIHT